MSMTQVDERPRQLEATRVRRARPVDLAVTAEIHRRCLPEGFFAQLGPRFLARYHASFAASRCATMLVAEGDDGQVLGFLVGTVDNARHYRVLARRPPVGLVLAAVAALLRDPRLAWKFVGTRSVRYVRALRRQLTVRDHTPAEPATDPDGDDAAPVVGVLTHVAVSETARGSGAGRALVDRFVELARAADVRDLRLITANPAAAGFYHRSGWRSVGERAAADGTLVEEFRRRP